MEPVAVGEYKTRPGSADAEMHVVWSIRLRASTSTRRAEKFLHGFSGEDDSSASGDVAVATTGGHHVAVSLAEEDSLAGRVAGEHGGESGHAHEGVVVSDDEPLHGGGEGEEVLKDGDGFIAVPAFRVDSVVQMNGGDGIVGHLTEVLDIFWILSPSILHN